MRYITVLTFVLLAGCSVDIDRINKSIEVCENNGGLEYIYIYVNDLSITCSNTASFYIEK